jgi:hypothetical protein
LRKAIQPNWTANMHFLLRLFEPLMYSPAVMSEARAMGDYLRYKSAIGNTLSELAILLTAREWT